MFFTFPIGNWYFVWYFCWKLGVRFTFPIGNWYCYKTDPLGSTLKLFTFPIGNWYSMSSQGVGISTATLPFPLGIDTSLLYDSTFQNPLPFPLGIDTWAHFSGVDCVHCLYLSHWGEEKKLQNEWCFGVIFIAKKENPNWRENQFGFFNYALWIMNYELLWGCLSSKGSFGKSFVGV